MRQSESWRDYELIDACGGERLERWGDIILIRPDPQIIWHTSRSDPAWRRADARYLRANTGGGRWEHLRTLPPHWEVAYRDLRFRVGLMGFKHTGLFPEQAVNWDLMRGMIGAAHRPVSVLNLFAYTGGATLACAAAGATVCHVDASKGMLTWARENAALAGLADKPIRWILDDCIKFVGRERRRGRRYDAIIMDPPSYGRGPGGEVWKLEEHIADLISLCLPVLSQNPLFFAVNTYTAGLSPAVMSYLLSSTLIPAFGGAVTADEIGLPVTASGLTLPCGATAIWTARGGADRVPES